MIILCYTSQVKPYHDIPLSYCHLVPGWKNSSSMLFCLPWDMHRPTSRPHESSLIWLRFLQEIELRKFHGVRRQCWVAIHHFRGWYTTLNHQFWVCHHIHHPITSITVTLLHIIILQGFVRNLAVSKETTPKFQVNFLRFSRSEAGNFVAWVTCIVERLWTKVWGVSTCLNFHSVYIFCWESLRSPTTTGTVFSSESSGRLGRGWCCRPCSAWRRCVAAVACTLFDLLSLILGRVLGWRASEMLFAI